VLSDDHPVLDDSGAVTAAAVERMLRVAGTIEAGVRVRSLRAGVAPGSGLLGRIGRIQLEYDPLEASGPRSLIVKSPAVEFEDSRALNAVEVEFYRQRIPKRSGIRAPEVYGWGLDEQTGRGYLLLEDVGDRGFVRQIDGCSAEQAEQAIGEIARLHARWWNDVLPAELGWICPPAESPVGRFAGRWIRSYAGEWPALLAGVAGRLGEGYEEIGARLARSPRTIVHGDFHSGNIAFGPAGVTLIDFQFVQHASGMVDVARFLATSLRTDVRRAIEADVLRTYRTALAAGGVRPADVDRCTDELRAALLWNVSIPLALHIRKVMTEGRPWSDSFPILERCLAAIDDWDALDHI
jgi:hypothetical protein